ncbi:MAG: TlpA disulfide reductase family protein [Candidatus Thiodiazotropha sp. 6PLUC2]
MTRFNLHLISPILLGLLALPSTVVSAPQSPEVCESRAFDSGMFRAYTNPKPVSKHAFSTNGGRQIKLSTLPGPRALLVNFWTTWCTPCKEEMPSMDRLQGRISPAQLLILPLVRDGKGLSEAKRFYKSFDITNLPVAADRFGKISYDHNIGALPQTLFVDQGGLVKGILTGAVDWESKPVLELLDSCLNIKIEQDTAI